MSVALAAIVIPWKEVLIVGALAGLVRFIWNAIAWMAMPHHHGDFDAVSDPAPLEAALRENKLRRTFYVLPHYKNYAKGMGDPDYQARMKSGPNAMLLGVPDGGCMNGKTFLYGFLNNVLEGVVLALLIVLAAGMFGVSGCLDTVIFSAALGAFITFAGFGAQVIWMGFPRRYFWTSLFDNIVGYALMGGAVYGSLRWLF